MKSPLMLCPTRGTEWGHRASMGVWMVRGSEDGTCPLPVYLIRILKKGDCFEVQEGHAN